RGAGGDAGARGSRVAVSGTGGTLAIEAGGRPHHGAGS
ncbi:MAG: hypothetical protein QOH30_2480, partial [Baekduia sp.]|nr:hypothetical protein [Baekduia sp.]